MEVVRNTRVLVVYQHLPHYRDGVFRELSNTPDMDFVFAADIVSRGSIPTLDPSSLPTFRRLRNLWAGPFLWQRGLVKALLRENFDVVIFLGDWKYVSTWIGQAVARLKGTKVFLWTIGWHRPERGVKRLLRLMFYRLADRLLLYGPDGRDIGAMLGFPLERMVVIGNSHSSGLGKDGRARPELLPRSPSGQHCFTVGAVVRLQESKRLDVLLKALRLLGDRGERVSAVIAGDGPARASLERLASELGVDAEFTGAMYETEELVKIYRRLDITVLPDAAGLTVVQSLAHGVPVITANSPFTQMPEFRAVVDGVTGGLYYPVEAEPLASKISEWKRRLTEDDSASVSQDCTDEINANWVPEVHAERIRKAIRSGI